MNHTQWLTKNVSACPCLSLTHFMAPSSRLIYCIHLSFTNIDDDDFMPRWWWTNFLYRGVKSKDCEDTYTVYTRVTQYSQCSTIITLISQSVYTAYA